MKAVIKSIYHLLPFKQTFFSLLKKVWSPNESVFKHLHFKGVFRVPIDESTSFKIKHHGFQIENEIFWAGLTNSWEKESLKLWIKLCQGCESIFDIGANTGVYALVAKTVNPSSNVYAFEPVERVFEKLEENIKLNNYKIRAINKAVSNSDGTAVIYDTPSEHTYSVTVNENRLPSGTKEVVQTTIETITLNSFIKQNNINRVDLIKIDVETHEPEVLEGLSNYLTQFRPSMLIEILNEEIGDRVNYILQGLDYLYFIIDDRTGARQVEKITKSDYYNYLVCNAEIAKKIGLIQ
jgi:FkbM family methyltransferase